MTPHFQIHNKQGVTLTGRNTIDPSSRAAPWWVTLHTGMLQMTTCQRANQY